MAEHKPVDHFSPPAASGHAPEQPVSPDNVSSSMRPGDCGNPAALQQQAPASDSQSHRAMTLGNAGGLLGSAGAEPQRDAQTSLSDSKQADTVKQHDSDVRTHRQALQAYTSQTPSAELADNIQSSVRACDAGNQSCVDTASLYQHSLPPAQRRSSTVRPLTTFSSPATAESSCSQHSQQSGASQACPDAASQSPADSQSSAPTVHQLADRGLHAGPASQPAAVQRESQHSQADGARSANKLGGLGNDAHSDAESGPPASANGKVHEQREQREGLLSDSEEEFERSIVAARSLRLTNAAEVGIR